MEQSKILGLDWYKRADNIVFKLKDIVENSVEPVTKCNVMHLIGSFYDPLGLVNPIIVKLKMFFQKLCIAKLGWDDLLPDLYLQEWNDILNSFIDCSDIIFPRLYSYRDADAACGAYGCCIYLRFSYSSGKVTTALVTAKSRVKPLSDVTIPRLELLGALLLSRLMHTVQHELSSLFEFSQCFYWTDSSIVYSW